MKKLQLIHPADDDGFRSIRPVYDTLPPPIGLEILAAYVVSRNCPVQVEILDGNALSFDTIAAKIDADVIGISDWYSNHRSAMRFAQIAKRQNPTSTVIVGGPNASNLGSRILNNRPYVDLVVCGDGEEALLGVLQDRPRRSIPNLWYRSDQGTLEFTYTSITNIDRIPRFTLEHIYRLHSDSRFTALGKGSSSLSVCPMPLSSVRGCIKATMEKPCSFCALSSNSKVRLAKPERFWDQINFLHQEYGIQNFFETGDDFVVGDYPLRLALAKPRALEIGLRVYADPKGLSESNIQSLREIGVNEVFVGFESLSDDVLRNANKSRQAEMAEAIVAELLKYEIAVFPSFIIGLPGETVGSLTETNLFIRMLLQNYSNIHHLLLSLAVPIIGSRWFDDLAGQEDIEDAYKRDTGESIRRTDDLDYGWLLRQSLRKQSFVSFDDLTSTLDSVLSIRTNCNIGSYGCLERPRDGIGPN